VLARRSGSRYNYSMNYGIRNIEFDYSTAEVRGTAIVGGVHITFEANNINGKTSWSGWVTENRGMSLINGEVTRDKLLRRVRKEWRLLAEISYDPNGEKIITRSA